MPQRPRNRLAPGGERSQGIRQNELQPSLDADMLAAKVMGAMVWRAFIQRQEVDDEFIERIVKDSLQGWTNSA